MARYILISLSVFVLAFSLCFFVQQNYVDKGAGDFYFPICGALWLRDAHSRVQGFANPYAACPIYYEGEFLPQNPLTSILVALPFSVYGFSIGGPALFATLSALATYACLQTGENWRLWFLASPVYFAAMWYVQWSPAMLALVYLPTAWMFLALAKPQIGLPIFLTRFLDLDRGAWIAAISCLTFLGISLLIGPTWPLDWWREGSPGTYTAFTIPILTVPGFLLAGWFYFWKRKSCRLLALMACFPQRNYDPLALWAVPTNKNQMLIFTGCSWITFAAHQQDLISLEFYLLSLYVVLSGLLLAEKIRAQRKLAYRHES